jgi:hypothetical protein
MPCSRYWSVWKAAGDEDVKREAKRRKVDLLVVPTSQAIEALEQSAEDTNAILHVTC